MKNLRTIFLVPLVAIATFAASPEPKPAVAAALKRAEALAAGKEKNADDAIAAFKEAIDADPDHLKTYEALMKFEEDLRILGFRQPETKPAVDAASATIQRLYDEVEQRHPESTGVLFVRGARLYNKEDPKATPLLRKVAERRPDFARVWFMLSIDADRWGDEALASEYMLRASKADPENPDYAFYYASGLHDVDAKRWEAGSREVARRFPQSERGAQALYWLGQRMENDAKRIAVWQEARQAFPPGKFSWTDSSMSGLYDAYIRTAPDKAVALAQEMAASSGENAKRWAPKVTFAEAFAEARTLVAQKKFAEATPLLDKLVVDRRSSNPGLTTLLKAEIQAGAGNLQAAYDAVMQRYAGSPEDELRAALERYGARLGKPPGEVKAETWKLREAAAKAAPAFELEDYLSGRKVSLEGLRGKVVFLTFWFPGCGPCRAEFPHFENVMRNFRGREVVYLGINGIRDQDDYVESFMTKTKYTFTPLKGEKSVTGPEGYAVRGYPANFLIDRNGRIVFRDFRAHDPASELVLQRMIEALLEG
jgi:thiol-disulfide isomerase/thioredoxin